MNGRGRGTILGGSGGRRIRLKVIRGGNLMSLLNGSML